MYGANLHQQEPDVAVAVGKDGYLKVFDLESGRELTNQRVPKPMARTNTNIDEDVDIRTSGFSTVAQDRRSAIQRAGLTLRLPDVARR